MANRGKAPMDARQEEQEAKAIREQSRLRQERLQRWQEDWEPCSPVPSPTADKHGHDPRNFVLRDVPSSQTQSILPGEGTSSLRHSSGSIMPLALVAPPSKVQPSEAQRQFLETVHKAQMCRFWSQIAAPVPPSKGPWYRFREGFYCFRYGASTTEVAYSEYQREHEREAGFIRKEDPLEDERVEILSLRIDSEEEVEEREPSEDNEVEADVIPDEENEAEEDDEEEAENEAEMEEEDEIEEDQSSEPQSTITDEPSVM